jgi:hypothetical protein
MKNQEIVHVRLESEEARILKRDILSTEANLLEISKIVRNFKKLRLEELNTKLKILKKLVLLKQNLTKLHNTLPKLKVTSPEKEEKIEKPKKKEEKRVSISKEEKYENEIEEELKKIQEKLRSLRN